MATVSTNEIIVQYKIGNPAELDKLVSTFAKVSDEEKESLEVMKEVSKQLKQTGNEGEKAMSKVSKKTKEAADDAKKLADETAKAGDSAEKLASKFTGPVARSSTAIREFTTKLKEAGAAAVAAGNKAAAGLNTTESASRKASATANEFRKVLGGVEKEVQAVNVNLKENATSLKQVDTNTSNLSTSLKGVGAVLAGAFSLSAINALRAEIVKTTIEFEGYAKGIQFASGSEKQFAANQEFLSGLVSKYGLDLRSTTEAYKQFLVASTLAGQSQEETNKQFQAVSKAATVMRLSADETQGAFLALGQMMSKGTVQAEELRGQLGERIPGAFSIMAKALNVNEKQLNKMLEQGEVLSKDALPAFANELEKTFGKEANNNLNGMVNSQNRFNSAMDGLILAIGNKLQPFLKGAYDLAAGIAKQITKAATEPTKAEEVRKKNTVELIALRRTENEIFAKQKEIGLASSEQEWKAQRQKIAGMRYVQMFEQISKQKDIVLEAKLAAVGALKGSALEVNLRKQEKELAILEHQLTLYEDIASVVITAPPKKEVVELTKEELKALEDQFKVRKNQLDLEREYRQLMADLNNNPGGRAAADREYYGALAKLKEDYKARGIDITQQDIENDRIRQQIAAKEVQNTEIQNMALYKEDQKAADDKEKLIKKEMDARVKANEEANKTINQQTQEFLDKEYQQILEAREKQKQLEEQRIAAITSGLDLASNLFTQFVSLRNSQLDNELVKVNRNAAEEVRLADGNAQKINEIEQKRAAKEKEIRTKQFRAEQAAAVARVIFETASMIAKWASNPVTFPLAAIALLNQTAQIGFILAQPVPEFAKGVENFQGGFAIVGEQGPELIKTPKGNMISPGKPTLTYLPKGSDVITAPKTKEILGLSSSYKKGQDKFVSVDVAPIAEAVRSIPVQSLHITERGLERFVQRGNRSTRILNKRRQEG